MFSSFCLYPEEHFLHQHSLTGSGFGFGSCRWSCLQKTLASNPKNQVWTKAQLYFWHVAPESKIPELYNEYKLTCQLCLQKWRDALSMARNDCFRRHFPQFLKHLHNRNGCRVCFLCIGCNRRAGGAALYAWVTARKQPFNRCFWGRALKGEKIAFVTNRDRKIPEVASGAAITFIRRN